MIELIKKPKKPFTVCDRMEFVTCNAWKAHDTALPKHGKHSPGTLSKGGRGGNGGRSSHPRFAWPKRHYRALPEKVDVVEGEASWAGPHGRWMLRPQHPPPDQIKAIGTDSGPEMEGTAAVGAPDATSAPALENAFEMDSDHDFFLRSNTISF